MVDRKILNNKPLLEAIFELRWQLQEPTPDIKIDPHYKLLIGSIYNEIKDKYPFHEQLPTVTIPDEISAYVVQHRFRNNKNDWPLIQIGPGILTLNDTHKYVWEDFENRIPHVVDTLFQTYPDLDLLKVNELKLRYIDGITFDYENEKILNFLREKLKIDINIHDKLFDDTGVSDSPLGFDLRFSFSSTKPKGAIHIRFSRGKRKEEDALIWETMIQSIGEDVPKDRDNITTWVKEAHNLTDDWFFKLIEGELQRTFE